MDAPHGNGAALAGASAVEADSYSIASEPCSDLVTPTMDLAKAIERARAYVRVGKDNEAAFALRPLGRWVESGDLRFETVKNAVTIAVCDAGEPQARGRRLIEWLVDQIIYVSDIPPPLRWAVNADGSSVTSDLAVMSPEDCVVGDPRRYLVKGLLAEGNLGCIFGHPGTGKSLIAPYLCYSVALGLPFFGHRTRQCRTLYVAAEDYRGMQLRTKALAQRHGDAPLFGLATVNDLLSADSPDRERLLRYAETEQPGLVVIDTLPAAWPGLEENDAAQMGGVVAYARQLSQWGACVILIHHPAKDLGATTPRGSGILNGDLDFSLQVYPRDDSGFGRTVGRKNRNGSIERANLSFRIDLQVFGVDADGDTITAALIDDTANAPRAVKLPRLPAEALKVLVAMVAAAGGPVAEDAWLTECVDRKVSTADTPRNQRTALRAAYAMLRDRRLIAVGNGMVGLPVAGENEAKPHFSEDAMAAIRCNETQSVAIKSAATARGDASNATRALGSLLIALPAVPGFRDQEIEDIPELQPSDLTSDQRAALAEIEA